jgi:hypothetical protein
MNKGINDHSTKIEIMNGVWGLIVSHTIPPKNGPINIPIDSRRLIAASIFPLCFTERQLRKFINTKLTVSMIVLSIINKIANIHKFAEFIINYVTKPPIILATAIVL